MVITNVKIVEIHSVESKLKAPQAATIVLLMYVIYVHKF